MVDRFRYLKVGLAGVLVFVGFKMRIVDFYKVPIAVFIAIIATTLTACIIASLIATARLVPAVSLAPAVKNT